MKYTVDTHWSKVKVQIAEFLTSEEQSIIKKLYQYKVLRIPEGIQYYLADQAIDFSSLSEIDPKTGTRTRLGYEAAIKKINEVREHFEGQVKEFQELVAKIDAYTALKKERGD